MIAAKIIDFKDRPYFDADIYFGVCLTLTKSN
jgi:hypothetical protein